MHICTNTGYAFTTIKHICLNAYDSTIILPLCKTYKYSLCFHYNTAIIHTCKYGLCFHYNTAITIHAITAYAHITSVSFDHDSFPVEKLS